MHQAEATMMSMHSAQALHASAGRTVMRMRPSESRPEESSVLRCARSLAHMHADT